MKKVLTKLLAVGGIGLLMLSACKKSDLLATSNGGKAGPLTSSTTTLPLDKTKLADPTPVITFTFSAADYGFKAAVTNTLQIDSAGDNWKKPMSVTLPAKIYSQGYSTAEFNSILLKLNLKAGVTSQVQARIVNSVSTSIAPVYSNVVNLTVTPFNLAAWVYVPGAYEGWNNPGPMLDSLLSATSNGIYTGIINFTAGNNQFLIVPVKGSWANKYATIAAPATGTTVTYPTELVASGGNNFYAPTAAGQYLVTLNTNNNTLTIAPADFYSVIGSATPGGDWSTDLWLKFVNDGNNNWVGTLPLLAGQFKFRQDAAWSFSWGTPQAGSPGAGIPNTLNNVNNKNDNINVATGGTFTVTFNAPLTLLGATPPVTTTYSVK
ncbi:MAG TPA: SusE domain-containing protein [Mucilaginibacter sp.]|jgi:hypothetical protein